MSFTQLIEINNTSCTYSMCESSDKLIQRISELFNLNKEQHILYEICVKQFIQLNTFRNGHSTSDIDNHSKPLQMVLTGPGDTGKTHIVNALKAIMNEYKCVHQI